MLHPVEHPNGTGKVGELFALVGAGYRNGQGLLFEQSCFGCAQLVDGVAGAELLDGRDVHGCVS